MKLLKKIKSELIKLWGRTREALSDIFEPYRETLEGIRAVWYEVIRKKKSTLLLPELQTVPVVGKKEKPESMIEAKVNNFPGYPLTGKDLGKIRYALSHIDKNSPAYIDIVLDNPNYTILFSKYPRLDVGDKCIDRYESVLAYNGKAVFVYQCKDSDRKAVDILCEVLLRNSIQFVKGEKS